MTAADFIAPDPDTGDATYIPPEKDAENPLALSPSQTPKPWHQVALPSLSFAGVQLAWAVLIGHATAHLRKLGLSDRAVGLAWLAGPVTGTLVQPIVGALSDDCTSRLGRRRPFMIFGSVLTFSGLMLFSQAGAIAARLGDAVNPKGGGSRTGLAIGLVSFWVVDFAVNVLQTPTRALLADYVPVGQLPLGSALFAVANGFGKGIGYALGAFCPSIREAFGAAGAVILVLTAATVVFVREEPRAEEEVEKAGVKTGRRGLWQVAKETGGKSVEAVQNMPAGVGSIFVVQWLTYLALMYLFIYGCDWVGRDVFGGDGDAAPGSAAHARFEAGVRFGNAGLLGMAVCSMAVAPLIPAAVRRAGVRRVWCASLAATGAPFLLAPWAGRRGAGAMLAGASLGVSSAFTIPWALVSAAARGERRGVLLATFNLSQATPGLVAATTGGLLVHAASGSLRVVMVAVGVCALCAALAATRVDERLVRGGGGVTAATGGGGAPAAENGKCEGGETAREPHACATGRGELAGGSMR